MLSETSLTIKFDSQFTTIVQVPRASFHAGDSVLRGSHASRLQLVRAVKKSIPLTLQETSLNA